MLTRVTTVLNKYAIVIPILLILVVQYRLWFDDSGWFASQALKKQIAAITQDNAVHQDENNYLLAEVEELRNGTELLEEKAREELGLIKEGESFILFAEGHKL